MACWALQFAPCVTVAGQDHTLLIEVQSVLRLWGGKQALLQRLHTGFADLGWAAPDEITMACAPSARAAQWLALAQSASPSCLAKPYLMPEVSGQLFSSPIDSQLGACPIDVIEELRPTLTTFARMGIRTIGQLAKLPRSGLTRRAGASVLQALDEAMGVKPQAFRWISLPETFHVKRELPARADHTDLVEQAAARCFHELSAWLLARQCAVHRLCVTLHHDDGPHTPMQLKLACASRDVTRFKRLFSERLARFALPRPVYEISVSANDIVPLAHRTEDFLGANAQAQEAMHELIERLSARLGEDCIKRLIAQDEHRPEKSMHEQALPYLADASQEKSRPHQRNDHSGSRHGHWSDGLVRVHRPAWLLRSPLRLGMHGDQPMYHGALKLLAGPERIEAGWWDDTPPGAMRRDYFIARSGQEELLWVFRTPLHEWYLHGLFG